MHSLSQALLFLLCVVLYHVQRWVWVKKSLYAKYLVHVFTFLLPTYNFCQG